MINVALEDYNKLKINGYKIQFPERIRQFEKFENFIALRLNAKKGDPEYSSDIGAGNIFLADENGIFWQGNLFVVNIWKIDDNTLGMYDGQVDLWLDVNKKEIIRKIWNPWGLDNPEKYK